MELFLLLMVRFSGLFLAAPLFSNRRIPSQVKVALVLVLALLLLPVAVSNVPALNIRGVWDLIPLVFNELVLGLAMGLAASLVFMAVQVAGGIIDWEMGFAIVNVLDPAYGTPMPLVGSFLYLLSLLIFLELDGHHLVLGGLARSIEAVPPGQLVLDGGLYDILFRAFARMFLAGVEISAPVLGALFVTSVVLGILARTVPQLNVFIVGIPLKILVGFFLLLAVLPVFIGVVDRLIEALAGYLAEMVRVMGVQLR